MTNNQIASPAAQPGPDPRRPRLSPAGLLTVFVVVLGVLGAGYLWLTAAQRAIHVVVASRELPAFHRIAESDLGTRTYAERNAPANAVLQPTTIVGRYTLTDIPQQQPLQEAQLGPVVDTAAISNTVAVGLAATPAMVLGGTVLAGDIVDVAVSSTVPPSTEMSTRRFEHLLVLDVKPVNAPTATALASAAPAYVVVLAVPVDRRDEFAAQVAGGHVVVTRRISP